jgi:integrase
MSVKIRPYRKGGHEVDIMIHLANGETHRERRKSPYSSKSATLRWGRERERHLLLHGTTPAGHTEAGDNHKEVPTVAAFADRYMDGYAKANGFKPSTVAGMRVHLRVHLIPAFGDKQLDAVTSEDVQRFKAKLSSDLYNNTINKILSTLNTMLKCAVEWAVIEQLPVQIKRLRAHTPSMDFYDFEEYEKLLVAARAIGPEHLGFALLAGDAGMRAGEIRGLHWTSVDLTHRLLTVERSEYRGQFTTPKHDKIRTVPMTKRLASVLGELEDRKRPLVFSRGDNEPISTQNGRTWLGQALKKAELRQHGPHTLRHTFCSHLAMRGAAARVIQQLAGHSSLITTQRYMHLSPGATEAAIALLESPPPQRHNTGLDAGVSGRGDILETGSHRPPHTP